MTTNHVFYGLFSNQMDDAIETLIHTFEEDAISKYDATEHHFDRVYEDLISPSFFSDHKVIVVQHVDHYFDQSYAVEALIKYLKSPMEHTMLILKMTELPKGELKKAFDLYVEYHEFQTTSADHLKSILESMLKKEKMTMTEEAKLLLIERLSNRSEEVYSEMHKLMTYCLDTMHIEKKHVETLIIKPLEDNVFDMVSGFILNDSKHVMHIYHQLMLQQEDPLKIMGLIGRRLSDLEDVKMMLQEGLSQVQISERLKISSGRTFYLIKEAKQIQASSFVSRMKQLEQLDYDIKSGRIEKKLGLQLLLLGVNK
jgi:DNA polymerase III subunit delta